MRKNKVCTIRIILVGAWPRRETVSLNELAVNSRAVDLLWDLLKAGTAYILGVHIYYFIITARLSVTARAVDTRPVSLSASHCSSALGNKGDM